MSQGDYDQLLTAGNLDRQRANTKEEDPTGLLNEGMRYRDLLTGEFISRDPAGFVDGPNVYCYVGQNPWTSFDPEGLYKLDKSVATNDQIQCRINGIDKELDARKQKEANRVAYLKSKGVTGRGLNLSQSENTQMWKLREEQTFLKEVLLARADMGENGYGTYRHDSILREHFGYWYDHHIDYWFTPEGGYGDFHKYANASNTFGKIIINTLSMAPIGPVGAVAKVGTATKAGGEAAAVVEAARTVKLATNSEARQTLIHFTDEAGHAGITGSGELFASTGAKHARFGNGQYFTDITPEMIGASTKAGLTAEQVAAGQISMGQASSKLFGVPWNSSKMSHFIEIDVTGLKLANPRPGTFLLPNDVPLDLSGRIIRSGTTR